MSFVADPVRALALGILASLALALPAVAATPRPRVTIAVPFYTPEHFVAGVHRDWTAPRAMDFAQSSAALTAAVTTWCASPAPAATGALPLRDAARRQWQAAMVDWTLLSTVAIGPLLERRSARQIDFAPARPALIERAALTPPDTAAAMDLVGSPAKGLPALEWLLWTQPAEPGTPQCRYAIAVAVDIEREAVALQRAFAALAAREWDAEAAATATGEIVNQWIGAVERLRWASIDKPLRAASGRKPDFPRSASGTTAAQWAAQWEAIAAIAVLRGPAPPAGTGLVPLEAYLRGRGLNPAADALVAATQKAAGRMAAIDTGMPARVSAAARDLTALKQVAESRVAPPLKINVGFSDADGD